MTQCTHEDLTSHLWHKESGMSWVPTSSALRVETGKSQELTGLPAQFPVWWEILSQKKQASKQQSSPDMLLWPLHVHTQCMHLYSDIHVPHMSTRTHKKVKHMFEGKHVGHVYSHSTWKTEAEETL